MSEHHRRERRRRSVNLRAKERPIGAVVDAFFATLFLGGFAPLRRLHDAQPRLVPLDVPVDLARAQLNPRTLPLQVPSLASPRHSHAQSRAVRLHRVGTAPHVGRGVIVRARRLSSRMRASRPVAIGFAPPVAINPREFRHRSRVVQCLLTTAASIAPRARVSRDARDATEGILASRVLQGGGKIHRALVVRVAVVAPLVHPARDDVLPRHRARLSRGATAMDATRRVLRFRVGFVDLRAATSVDAIEEGGVVAFGASRCD